MLKETKTINIKIPVEVWREFSAIAVMENKQKKELLEEIIQDFNNKYSEKIIPGRKNKNLIDVKENEKIKTFMNTDTYNRDRGYIIHISRESGFENEAVIEDQDGRLFYVDVSEYDWQDLEDFLDVVVQKYEGKMY